MQAQRRSVRLLVVPPPVPLLAFILLLAPPSGVRPLGAQADTSASLSATPLLPADHWVRPVLGRLDAMGALSARWDPAAGSWTVGDAVEALEDAGSSSGAASALARSSAARLRTEVGLPAEEGASALPRRLPAWLEVGVRWHVGALTAGYDTAAAGPPVSPRPREALQGGEVGALLALRPFAWLTGEARAALRAGAGRFVAGNVVVDVGPVRAWGGRRSVAYGPTPTTPGLLLGGAVPADAVAVALARGRELPGRLGWLGPVGAETTVGRLDAAGATARPWLWTFRASVRPHPRVRLALERAALLGGGGSDVDAGDVLDLLLGRHGEDSGIANQALAVDAAFRPPLGGLPVLLYASLGADDSAGAWWHVPAYVTGLELASVPGAPWLELALDRTAFARSCCGNPPWYRHLRLPWTGDGRSLGHALGGHGSEWAVRARADWPARGAWGSFVLFTRRRGAENLFAPSWAGRSVGLEMSFRVLGPWPGGELNVTGSLERDGSSWRERRLFVGARRWF